MEILKFSVRFWEICGVYQRAASSIVKILLSYLSVLIILSGLLTFFWLSLANVISNRGNEIIPANMFYPVTQMCAVLAVFGTYVAAVFVRVHFSELVELLQQAVNESNYMSAFRIVSISESNYSQRCV